jgi:uncharacterized protein YfaS (alpha-2-macroglobulin family)
VLRTYEAVDEPGDVRRDDSGVYHVKRGARVRTRLYMVVPAERHYVALSDPLPAGLEAMDAELAVTPSLPEENRYEPPPDFGEELPTLPAAERERRERLRRMRQAASFSWYDERNLRDERIEAFATSLGPGVYALHTVCRATTPGSFVAPPPKALEIHDPETFGRGEASHVVVE